MLNIGIMEFTSDELSRATEGFHPHQKVGEGGFGSVYRGTLRHTAVAIKVLSRVIHTLHTEWQLFDLLYVF